MDAIDLELKGVARPNRRVHVDTRPYWITIVNIDGEFMEWILYDTEQVIARDNTSMELLEPVYARELYLEVTGDETVRYTLTVTVAKET